MATIEGRGSSAPPNTLFVRKASGLVKSWAPWDAFVYAFACVSPAAALYIFSSATFLFGGSIFWAAIIGGACVCLEIIVYAALITAMPRAGGDYLWQTRIFNSATGSIVATTGWWFVEWHWVPLFAIVNITLFLQPMINILGLRSLSDWIATPNGVFVSCLVAIFIAGLVVATGMRIGKYMFRWAFYLGTGAFLILLIALLVSSQRYFVTSVNAWARDLYGVSGNTYAATLKAGGQGQPSNFLAGSLGATFALIPYLAFWMLWPNWGATLVGEVRGAKDFRKNVWVMGGALLLATILVCSFLALADKTFGYKFYMASGYSYWMGTSPLKGQFMSPAAMASSLIHNSAIQFVLLGAMSGLAITWTMTNMLSSTRVIFAMAFDRVLPAAAAKVTRAGVPWVALLLMIVPSIFIAYLYAYTNWFVTLTLDATLLCAVTFLVTSLGAMVMPWRMKGLYETTVMAKWKIGPVPVLTLAGAGFSVFLVALLYLWLKDPVYGVNNNKSLIYMGVLYGSAALIWVVAFFVRRKQGMPLEAVVRQIPEDAYEPTKQ
jgi:amino acid transporter